MIVYEIRYKNCDALGNMILFYKSDTPDEYPVFSPKYKIEINTVGSMSFTIGCNHPAIDDFQEMKTFVMVKSIFIKNGVTKHTFYPFAGRVITIETDDNGNKQVTCEGVLGLLNDTFITLSSALNNMAFGSSASDTKTVKRALSQMTWEFNFFHDNLKSPWRDYKNVFDTSIRLMTDESYYTIEHVYGDMDSGSVIEMDSQGQNIYAGDYTMTNYWDILSTYLLNKYGGFLLQCYDTGNSGIRLFLKYYSNSIVTGEALVNYPNESYDDIQFARWDWIPYFEKGKNVIRWSKENAIDTKYSGIYPVGKDGLNLGGRDDGYLWNSDLVSMYGAHIPYIVNFPSIDTAYALRSNATLWSSAHRYDAFLPKKYTITGPEPCELGCGDMMIMLMRDVTIREDPSEDLINCLHLPCLSMEIDIQNPQNNTYVIGPFIDGVYTNTTISKFSAGNRR